MKRMERHRGHLLNWYDTRTLAPLEPRYVSTVDSGNLAASLSTLKEGCLEIASGPVFSSESWNGLIDMLDLLKLDLDRLDDRDRRERLCRMLEVMEGHAAIARDDPTRWLSTLDALVHGEGLDFEDELRKALEEARDDLSLSVLRDIRIWLDRVHQKTRMMDRDIDAYAPWARLWASAPSSLDSFVRELKAVLPLELPLSESAKRLEEARHRLASIAGETTEEDWVEQLVAALNRGESELESLRRNLRERASQAEAMALEMDFRWLYDDQTRLFHIGYNVSAEKLDSHQYDLLASEARIASLIAIAKGDVPVEHWFHLGRGVTEVGSKLCLISWGGSMFEYLMPTLLLRTGKATLLAQSERAAVAAHQAHAASLKLPWGVSESGFASLDADRNYRYRAFGVPGLGLRRALGDDAVVAPYATLLALSGDPSGALDNLRALVELGAMGEYGLFEAADFTPERVPEGRRVSLVMSYMAHHQGMILSALDNALCDDALRRRMHADSRVRLVELLLHERIPSERPPELLSRDERPDGRPRALQLPPLHSWFPAGAPGSALHLLGNGRLSSSITDSGTGGLFWHDYALTRWVPDPTRETQGLCFYVKDEETGEQWPAVSRRSNDSDGDGSVIFHPHLADFQRRHRGIMLRMEVAVVPADDLEIRRFTLTNESSRARTITLTSYAEVVLALARDDARHPAFSKLFIRSEWIERRGGLIFTRRPKTPAERPPVLFHRLVAEAPGIDLIGYETDRRAFLGRGRDVQNPEGWVRSSELSTGYTLDAVASLCVRIELKAGQSQNLAFLTAAAGSRESALEMAERYQTPTALDWVIADAARDAARQIQSAGIEGAKLPLLQHLASLLVYPRRAFRCSAERLRANHFGQPRLWGMGLSGDLPILLLKISEPDTTELLADLVAGHRLWRENGLSCDLVVLREAASGYVEPIGEKLLDVLQEHGEREQLGRAGGIHFIAADQITEDDRSLLHVAARVVLDTHHGSLASQLARVTSSRAPLPVFTPSRWEPEREPTTPIGRPEDLVFDNGFGGFSPDGRDYVIFLGPGETTPAPWSNVLANEQFGCLVDESGGGFSWAGNSGENRLSPWTNDPVSDASGEALYLRDEETGVVWSPTPAPAGRHVAHEIRHTAGRTQWRSNAEGLEQTLSVFVPPDDPVKLIHLRLRNVWNRPRRLTATYYIEWVLGVNRSEGSDFIVAEYDSNRRALLARNAWSPEFAERVAFLASSAESHSVTTDREEFLGRGGSMHAPAALGRWGLSGQVEPGGDPCGALQIHLELQPDEEIEVHFVLGQGCDRAQTVELVRRWRDPAAIGPAWESTKTFWDDVLEQIRVRTPDAATNLMLNRWLLHQTLACRLFARSAFYQSGGAFGFRDQLQDALALTHAAPDRLRWQLLECAAHQFAEGDVLHWWHPPSGRGVRTRISDDLLWLPFAAAHYVESTGDEAVLDESIPFLQGALLSPGESERYARFQSESRGTSLFEHCQRALERGVSRGSHDLPLIGAGDWNDGMNRVGAQGVGESIWLGWFAIAAIQGFVNLCELRGEVDLARHWRSRRAELSRAVETSGWDGSWYRRALDDLGQPWGSHESEECRIDSIAQSWSVLSRAGDETRTREALRSVETELVREDEGLIRLLWPPFDHTLRDPGYIKAYPPGIRENGGQYTHAAAWLGWAYAKLGEADRAMRIFRLINPIGHALDRDAAIRYRVEPYVVAADIASVAPHVGRGGWTWYTGAAGWTWRLGVEGLLGIRRVASGLSIQPCIPTDWGEAEVRYRCPNGVLVISIEDPERVGHGRVRLDVDGEPHPGSIVPLPEDGKEHHVRVRLERETA
jgi:cyclic beta-1,2-glucan synthetase